MVSLTLSAKTITTGSILKNPESATIYNNHIYVTNMGEKSWKNPDKDGFISKLSLDGKAVDLKFTEELNDPKGMAVYKDSLVVTDITELVIIDFKSKKVLRKIKTPGVFLNDIYVSEEGVAYVTDTYKSKIYSVDLLTSKVTVIKENMQEAPNGIYLIKNDLYIASWANKLESDWSAKAKGRFLKINLKNNLETFITRANLGNLDGVEPLSAGKWLVSDKKGNVVYEVDEKSGEYKALDMVFTDVADIHYSLKHGLLVAPLMGEGKLIILKI